MRVIAVACLALTLASSGFAKTTAPVPKKQVKIEPPPPKKKGTWQVAESGRAVFCYGPVVVMNGFTGEPKRFATQCRGELGMVPLKD